MGKKIGKILFFGALLGLVFYATVYLLASRGDAFKFVEQRIKNSHAIESEVGKIESIRLSPFGAYEDKSAGMDEWATMTVKVSSVTKTVFLEVRAKKTNSAWEIDWVTRDGKPIALN